MPLSPDEREALLRIFGSDIVELCGTLQKVGLSITYHRVKGRYEYPALVVQCKGKRRKLHISQDLWKAFREEVERIKLEKLIASLGKVEKLSFHPANTDLLISLLEKIGEIYQNRKFWKFLLKEAEAGRLPKNIFKHRRFVYKDNLSVEVWDVEPLKELRFSVIKRDPVRGEVKHFETLSYVGREGNIYIISVKPLKVFELSEKGVREFLENCKATF